MLEATWFLWLLKELINMMESVKDLSCLRLSVQTFFSFSTSSITRQPSYENLIKWKNKIQFIFTLLAFDQRVLFSLQPFWQSKTETRCRLQPLKQNPELVLVVSIAAAVESQTINTCKQLRNISKNMEFVEGEKWLVVMTTKIDLTWELPGTWFCFQYKI